MPCRPLAAAALVAAAQSCTFENHTDFNGNDIAPVQRRPAASPEACCALCAASAALGCKAWTFMPAKTCYLKTSDAGRRSPFKNYVSGTLAGPPPPPAPSPTPAPPSPPTPGPQPPATPLPHGGGECADDIDCSLGGECRGGACACDPQYTGAQCGVLRLRRAKVHNGLQLNSTATHTWGGHALKDPATGKWVGFFSYMAAGCGLHQWQSNSMIITATSSAPDGPYDQDMAPVTAPWTHNAMITQHPNGSYFLFHIGEGTPKKALSNCSGKPDPFFPFPSEGRPEPPAAATHVSESLQGPWRPAPGVPSVNNPCAYFFPNGTTLIFDRTSVRWATSVDGKYTSNSAIVVDGSMRPEDPGVWRDHRGNFHMLFNANSGHKHCKSGVPCGGHAWSTDGITWSNARSSVPSFGTIVHYEDGSTVTWDYVERPQIAQDGDGKPLTLFLGQSYQSSHTLAIMFCQEGDADCVTTVQ